MTDGSGETLTSENAIGETTTSTFESLDGNTTTTYTYFPTGARATLPPPLGSVNTPEVTYTYDATGQMATETDWLGHTTTFSHDQDNNATGNADPNGTTITNTYNSDEVETNAAATTTSGGSPIVSYGTPRNGADQLASETDSVSGVSGSTTNYGYTNADQCRRSDPRRRPMTVRGTRRG